MIPFRWTLPQTHIRKWRTRNRYRQKRFADRSLTDVTVESETTRLSTGEAGQRVYKVVVGCWILPLSKSGLGAPEAVRSSARGRTLGGEMAGFPTVHTQVLGDTPLAFTYSDAATVGIEFHRVGVGASGRHGYHRVTIGAVVVRGVGGR